MPTRLSDLMALLCSKMGRHLGGLQESPDGSHSYSGSIRRFVKASRFDLKILHLEGN